MNLVGAVTMASTTPNIKYQQSLAYKKGEC